jgi:tetratricopeptide (TPR) repeat protein
LDNGVRAAAVAVPGDFVQDDSRDELRAARAALQSGQLETAAAAFERRLRAESDDVEARLGLCQVALARADYENARIEAGRALAIAPANVDAKLLHALAVEGLGDRQGALEAFRSIAVATPTSTLAAYHTGRLLAALGQHGEAAPWLERAARLEPGRIEIQSLLGYALAEQGKLEEAERVHRRALLADSGRMESWLGLSELLARRGELDAAIALLDQARQSAGEHPESWWRQAMLFARKGDFKEAARRAQRVCELQPEEARSWLDVAGLRLRAGEPAAAERAALQARALAPDSWQAHFQLGLVYDAGGRLQMAEAAYREAVRRCADSWEPSNNLGLVMLAQGSPRALEEAETLFRQAAELAGPGEPGPRVNLALTLGRRGQSEHCRRLCNELLEGDLSEAVRKKVKELLTTLS